MPTSPAGRWHWALAISGFLTLVCVPGVGGEDPNPESCSSQSMFRSDLWKSAAEEYFFLSKLSVTPLGGKVHAWRPLPEWISEDDHVVRNSFHENDDIRSHLPRLFEYTLFFAPETIVELGVRSGWSSRAFSAAARLIDAVMIGIDLEESCKRVYEDALVGVRGFCEAGSSWEMAQNFPEYANELMVKNTVDLLFIDTSHLYEDTVKELAAWEPFLSSRAAIILHDSNFPPHLSMIRKDGSRGEVWDNQQGVARAIQEFAGVQFNPEGWFDSGVGSTKQWRVMHDPTCSGLTILQRGA